MDHGRMNGLAVLSERNFRRFFVGQSASLLGDGGDVGRLQRPASTVDERADTTVLPAADRQPVATVPATAPAPTPVAAAPAPVSDVRPVRAGPAP